MIKLAAYRGDTPEGEVLVQEGQTVVIGRAAACGLVLAGDRTSREHCEVSGGPGGWRVRDLGSSNGTFLNGARVEEAPLAPGDLLAVGDFRVEVRSGSAGDNATEFSPEAGADGWTLTVLEGPGAGSTAALAGPLEAGRAADCGLVLEDPTVSRRHARFEPGPSGVRVTALNERNPVFLNGAPVASAEARNGDALKLGPFLLGLSRNPAAQAAHPIRPAPQPPATPATPAADHPGAPDAPLASRSGPSRRTLLLGAGAAGLVVLVLILVFASGPDKNRQIMEEEQKKAMAVEEAGVRKKIAAQMSYGRKYLDQGDPVQALERFKAVLELDPADAEARQMADAARQKIEEAERARQDAERRRKEQWDQARPLLDQARAALERGDHPAALSAVGRAGEILPGAPEVSSLRTRIEEAAQAEAERRERAEAENRDQARRLAAVLAQARQDYDQGRFTAALAGFRELAASGGGSREAGEAARYIPELEDLLARKAAPDLRQGEKFLSQKKYLEAYQSFRKVLEVLPGHKQASEKAAEALRPLEQEARKLYEEGLVYEGIGDQEEAQRRWQAVLTAMPVPDNVYVRKAKARLEQRGQRGTP